MGVYKGKSVNEAIENGLLDLNLKKEDVHIHVIEKGQAGIFGFFEKEAEVEITPLTEKELKLKKLAPYLSAGGFIIVILFFILIGLSQNNKSNSSTSLSSSTNPSSVTEKSTEKLANLHLPLQNPRQVQEANLVHLVLHQTLLKIRQLVPHNLQQLP